MYTRVGNKRINVRRVLIPTSLVHPQDHGGSAWTKGGEYFVQKNINLSIGRDILNFFFREGANMFFLYEF